MPNITLQVGEALAVGLAGTYLNGTQVSALSALIAAVNQYNADNDKSADYVPTVEELSTFIAGRAAKRIATPGERPGE